MRVRASFPHFLENLLLALWAGGLWVTGFVVAPTLFRLSDDRLLAGRVAGAIFETMGMVGLICGVLLLVLILLRPISNARKEAGIVLIMLVSTGVGQFVLSPEIGALRDAGGLAANPERFSLLHGLAFSLFLANGVLAVALIWLGASKDR